MRCTLACGNRRVWGGACGGFLACCFGVRENSFILKVFKFFQGLGTGQFQRFFFFLCVFVEGL